MSLAEGIGRALQYRDGRSDAYQSWRHVMGTLAGKLCSMRIVRAVIIVLLTANIAPPLSAADADKPTAKPTQNAKRDQQRPSQQPPVVDTAKSDRPQAYGDGAPSSKDGQIETYTFWLMVFNGALVVATTLLAIPSVWLACIARRTAERQLRAYIVVKAATVELVKEGSAEKIVGVVCRVAFLNAGQTPAYDLQLTRNTVRETFAFDPIFPDDGGGMHRTTAILGPRVEHPDDLGTRMNLSPQDVLALERGQSAIYMWGAVRYRDIFNRSRRTRFAAQWPRIPSKIDDRSTTACPHGNDAT